MIIVKDILELVKLKSELSIDIVEDNRTYSFTETSIMFVSDYLLNKEVESIDICDNTLKINLVVTTLRQLLTNKKFYTRINVYKNYFLVDSIEIDSCAGDNDFNISIISSYPEHPISGAKYDIEDELIVFLRNVKDLLDKPVKFVLLEETANIFIE